MIVNMSHILAPFISNLQSIVEHGGYIILFLITILEGIPAIGSLVPGHTAVILSGFLSRLYILNLYIVIPVVMIAAMLGDYFGYYLGKKYGYGFLKSFGKVLFIKDEYIEKAKLIINAHTGKSIIFGRFNPITRPLVPFVIGASHVKAQKFWLFDFIGVFIWSIISILIGYIFGASYHAVAGILGKFIIISIILAILIAWSFSFINKRFHIFAKYELFVLFFNLLGLYGFFKTIQDALRDHAFMAELDVWINVFFSSHVSAVGLSFMTIFTDIFSPTVISIATSLLIVYFLIKKQLGHVVISALSMGGGLIASAFVKEIVMRPRPEYAFIVENDFSFPSGHAIAVTIFFTLLIYFFARKIKNMVWRELFITISVVLIILTAISRLYLGVHWLSDVFAGISLGLFWTTLMILFVRYVGMIVNSLRNKKEL